MKSHTRCLTLIAAATFTCLISGCAMLQDSANLGGVGSVVYTHGQLQSVRGESVPQCYQAALLAMNDLGLTVTSKSGDMVHGRISAKEADETPIKIIIRPKDSTSTVISIRVALLGNESKSHLILSKLRNHL